MTIPAGQTLLSQPVLIIKNSEAEGTESFQAQLTVPSAAADLGVTLGGDNTVTVNITDNDVVTVEFSPTQYTITEGNREAELTLVANASTSFDYTVEVDIANGAAIG